MQASPRLLCMGNQIRWNLVHDVVCITCHQLEHGRTAPMQISRPDVWKLGKHSTAARHFHSNSIGCNGHSSWQRCTTLPLASTQHQSPYRQRQAVRSNQHNPDSGIDRGKQLLQHLSGHQQNVDTKVRHKSDKLHLPMEGGCPGVWGSRRPS